MSCSWLKPTGINTNQLDSSSLIMEGRMCVLESKTDHILRMVLHLEVLDCKMDRLLELVKKQQGDDVTSGTGDDICQDPLGDATVVTGDKMMTGEIVTGDITSVTYDVTDVVGDVKFENADSVADYQLSTAAGDVTTGSDQEEVTEADDTAAAVTGDGTAVARDTTGATGDVTSVTGDTTAPDADITAVSAPQQAVGYSHDWYRIFLLSLRKACRLLETKQSAMITAEGFAVISQLRSE